MSDSVEPDEVLDEHAPSTDNLNLASKMCLGLWARHGGPKPLYDDVRELLVCLIEAGDMLSEAWKPPHERTCGYWRGTEDKKHWLEDCNCPTEPLIERMMELIERYEELCESRVICAPCQMYFENEKALANHNAESHNRRARRIGDRKPKPDKPKVMH